MTEIPLARALPSQTVRAGRARFTVLTDRLVRMEWAADGAFEDRPTLAVVNRRMGAVRYRVIRDGRRTVVDTGALRVVFADNGRPLSPRNLSVTIKSDGGAVRWAPGMRDPGNLKGTLRTLDGTDGPQWVNWSTRKRSPIRMPDGLLSRSGWAVIDDSPSVVLDVRDGRPWVTPRPEGRRIDWYFAGYGHDYRAALAACNRLLGSQPLPPRFTLGYWWSRYWPYTDREMRQLVEDFTRMGVPLDVLVVDMDWHLPGWTGYTWDKRYFPDPKGFLDWLHKRGIRVTLNLHPADGVARYEEAFPAMCRALGLDPRRVRKAAFDISSPRYMDAYFRLLHHPMERQGVDFWWMDWQQGSKSAMTGLDPLAWLNYLHWYDMARRPDNRRPLIFSRFGGIGSGKYPIGFSGDTWGTWQCLAFQVYFTATAANVLYGHWSHDIGGHFNAKPDPELYLRWVQFGAHAPVLRTHATKNPFEDRRFQEYPSPYNRLLIETVRRRYTLVPYVYGENHRVMETGVSLCRPMYYDWPEAREAYQTPYQYMFGDHMLVSPVVTRGDEQTRSAQCRTWLPPGRWFDTVTGAIVSGGRWHTRRYLLNEIPVFVRPGAILPGQRVCANLSAACYRDLVVTAYPGGRGEYELYEDDGLSRGYLAGEFARTTLAQRSRGRTREITVGPSRGTYPGFARRRSLQLRLPSVLPAVAVRVNGRRVAFRAEPRGLCWSYEGDTATVVVHVPVFDITRRLRVRVTFDRAEPHRSAQGLAGLFSGLAAVHELMTNGMIWSVLHPEERLAAQLTQSGYGLSRDPAAFEQVRRDLVRHVPRLPAIIRGMARKQMTMDKNRVPFLDKALALTRVLLDERRLH